MKLNDFGLSILYSKGLKVEDDETEFMQGNFLYRSPERLRNNFYDSKSDVYSFALILWQLITREHLPLSKCNNLNELLDREHERPPIPPETPPSLIQLLQSMWNTFPDQRPDFQSVVSRLEEIILDVSIVDSHGKAFWRRNFVDPNTNTVSVR